MKTLRRNVHLLFASPSKSGVAVSKPRQTPEGAASAIVERVGHAHAGGWAKMNLQIVLETNIIGTTSSSPKIVDAYFWN